MSASITVLPEVVLLYIFQYLSLEDLCLSVRKVCKHWHELTYDVSLWKSLTLNHKSSFLKDSDLISLLETVGEHIENINLFGCTQLTDLGLTHGDIFCKNLKNINISETQITNEGLIALINKYPILESLECANCSKLTVIYQTFCKLGGLKQFQDPFLHTIERPNEHDDLSLYFIQIVTNSPGLKELKLGCSSIEDEQLVTGSMLCPHLEVLGIPHCYWISGEGLLEAVKHLPNLYDLDIMDTPIKDNELVNVARSLPKLQRLNVSECRKITDVGVSEVLRNCTLKHLILNDSRSLSGNITDVGLESLQTGGHHLETLKLKFCPSLTDKGIVSVAKFCTNLKELDLSACLSLTDASVRAIAENCHSLEVFRAEECVQFSGSGVSLLLENCSNLRIMELGACHHIANISLNAVGHKTSITPNLKVLDLSFCSKLTVFTVLQLATHCTYLKYLSLRGCYLIDDVAIAAVAKECKDLMVLDVSGGSTLQNSKLTDKSLLAIAENCRNLTMLSVTKSPLVSIYGIGNVIKKCCSLKRLQVTGAPNLNLAEVVHVIQEYRRNCYIKDYNIEYLSPSTKGNFLLKFPQSKQIYQ